MRSVSHVVAVAILIESIAAGCGTPASPPPVVDSKVTSAVEGPSLLSALHLSIDATSIGRLGGTSSAPAVPRREPMPTLAPAQGMARGLFSRFFGVGTGTNPVGSEHFEITGTDLYRINCQSCHGPDGEGSPPEVNSLVGPVQGTSLALLVQQMKEHDRPVDESFLSGVAKGAGADLRQRLREGGKKMPPFAYLSVDEVDALVGYLQRMVRNPDAPAPDPVLPLSAVRVGEQVVKGTCHVCHDATGAGRHEMMMQGQTLSLAAMSEEESLEGLVAKVREGVTPPMMGMTMSHGPSKMPRLPYLTPQELAAAMLYLRRYPPRE